MNRWVRLGLQTAFGLALLWLWLRTVSLPEVVAHARVQNWWAVALMIVLFLVTSVIRARRWLLLLRPLAPVGMVRAFAMNATGGLLNYILPIRFGDAARAWWLWRRHRVPTGAALATIVIDKAFDLAGVAVAFAALEVLALAGVVSAPRGLIGAAAPAVAAGAIVLYHAVTAAYALVLGLLGFLLVGGRRRSKVGAPRRIAVFHCGFTYSGGGERIVIEEVLGLRRRGYKVECYAPTVNASRCYPDLIGEVRVKTFLPQLPRWFPFREAVQMAATSLLMPLYAWRFRGVDAIVGCNQPSAWIAWWAARLMDVPYVVYLNQPNRLVYPRNVDRQTGWVSKADYRLLAAIVLRATRFVAWADRRSIQEADLLLVNGNYIGDIIRKTYGRDAVDCPAGCHVAASGYPLPVESRFAGGVTIKGYPIRRPYVLLTNRHYPQKRFDLAIRAMVEVGKRHPRVQLVIPGPATSHTAVWKALVTELGLDDAVRFLGPITEDELQALYEGAAVYVYPAPEEDFGMGVIESMATGVPVVAWSQAGPTVTVGPGTGHLAEPLDVNDYAAGINRLLDDRSENQVTGERAFEWARRFDWERHIDTMENAVLDVARAHEQIAMEAATA